MSAIPSIGTEQAAHVAARADAASEPSTHRAAVAATGAGNGGREYVVKLSNEAVDIANIQEAKNGLNDSAKDIRTADQSMRQIIDYIDRMKADLKAITKQYPPFPPGSEERVGFLKSFSSFRQLIDKLTFPPPAEEGARSSIAGR